MANQIQGLIDKRRAGYHLTQAECDVLNKPGYDKINKTCNKYKNHLKEAMTVYPVRMSKPDVLRLTLQRSVWQKFLDSASGFTPEKFLEAFDDTKQKLVDKRGKGQSLTADECDFLNKATRKNMEKVLDEFKGRVLKEMVIKPTVTAEEIVWGKYY